MSQVIFIVDQPNAQHNRLALCAQLLSMWIQRETPAFCLTENQDYADFLDNYLWTEQQFLPHIQGKYNPAYCQVTISSTIEDAGDCQNIFNCTNQALNPQKDNAYDIIEWVSNQPNEKAIMRERFAQYKALSIKPQTMRI